MGIELKSVRKCREGRYSLVLWKRDEPGSIVPAPWRCRSWRCPTCATDVAARDYARIRDALLGQKRLLYVVLTAPGWARERFTPAETFDYLGECWRERFRKPLARRLGAFAYVQTWERHRSGYPHVNVVLAGSQAVDAALGRGVVRRFHVRERRHYLALRFLAELRELATAAGFGPRLWLEPLRDGQDSHAALASYLAKIAREFVASAHKAGDQRPLDAPKGFRRLRSSRRFLPPRPSSDWTGRVVRGRIDALRQASAAELEQLRGPPPVLERLELERAACDPRAYALELERALARDPRSSLELAQLASADVQCRTQ